MQAAVQTEYGPPEVVRITEVAKPTLGPHDVLVQVRATTVNRTDCACRAAKPFFMRLFTGLRRPRATVLGNEYAGRIEAVGRDDVQLFEGSLEPTTATRYTRSLVCETRQKSDS